MLSRRSLRPSSINFAFEPPRPVAPREMRRANRGRELEVFADRQMLVEGVLLRDVTEVTFERVEILVERLAVEQHLAAIGCNCPPSTRMSVLLPEPLAPITQTSSPRLSAKLMPSSAMSLLLKR